MEKHVLFNLILKETLDCDEYNIPADAKNYSDIVWVKDTKKCSESEFNVALTEYDAQEHARNRQAEYPAIADQLDEIYHNGINAWKAVIKVTKDKYPKG